VEDITSSFSAVNVTDSISVTDVSSSLSTTNITDLLPQQQVCFAEIASPASSAEDPVTSDTERTPGRPGSALIGHHLEENADGEWVMMGTTSNASTGDREVQVAKLDSAGSLLWAWGWRLGEDDDIFAFKATSDGGMVLLGTTAYDTNDANALIMKLNAKGSLSWSHALVGSSPNNGYSIQEMLDGTLVLIGYTRGLTSLYDDILIARLNATGGLVWARSLNGGRKERGFAIQGTNGSDILLAGYTNSMGAGKRDALIARLSNQTGAIQWARVIGGADRDKGLAIEEMINGDIAMTGQTASFGLGAYDVLLARVNATGCLLWSGAFGTENDDIGYGIDKTTDGGFIVYGVTITKRIENRSLFSAKVSKNGWVENCSDASIDTPTKLNATGSFSFQPAAFTEANLTLRVIPVLINGSDATASLLQSLVDLGTCIANETVISGRALSDRVAGFPNGGALDAIRDKWHQP